MAGRSTFSKILPVTCRARYLVVAFGLCAVAELCGCGPPVRVRPPQPAGKEAHFTATAYSISGQTASGTQTRPGIVAADPAVLPLGSKIRVRDAGAYSGDYVVQDTGGKIRGRKIDIYVPKHAHAKRFGRRGVKVEVISYGHGRRHVRHVHRRHGIRHMHPKCTRSSGRRC